MWYFSSYALALSPGPSLLLRTGEGLVTFAIKTVAGSYLMLHQPVVSAPCHMIAVMKDDGLIHRKLWRCSGGHSRCRSRTTMQVQFDEMIFYAVGKLDIECFEQTLIACCAGNHESDMFVRNFHTAECWQPFQQCRTLSTIKNNTRSSLVSRLAIDTTLVRSWLSRAQSNVLSCTQMVQSDWCRTFSYSSLTAVLIAKVTRSFPAHKGGRGLGMRIVMHWWTESQRHIILW